MNQFILSTKRIKFKYNNTFYYIPKHILMYNNDDFNMFNLKTDLST